MHARLGCWAPVVIESDSFDRSRAGVKDDGGGTLLAGARRMVHVRCG